MHVTEMNDLHCMHYMHRTSFHASFHVILCRISHHFTSFHIIFHTFHCTHHTHRTHITHVAHFAFREQRAFHALHHTSCHFMYHFMSFCHENFISHSFIPFRSEESRNRVKTAHSSIERHLSGAFYSRG